jgi:hypothetical protein
VSKYKPGVPGRESNEVIAIDSQGNERAFPGLVGGPGVDLKNPEPGTTGWETIIQAGIDSAAAANPPNSMEMDLWRRVAEDQIPLDFVSRNDATLTLNVPSGWVPDPMIPNEEPLLDIPESPAFTLRDFLLDALSKAPWTITVSSHVHQPVVHGSTHVYPWEEWGEMVGEALEAVSERLIPEKDGVVVGKVKDEDKVMAALDLLAKATGR